MYALRFDATYNRGFMVKKISDAGDNRNNIWLDVPVVGQFFQRIITFDRSDSVIVGLWLR